MSDTPSTTIDFPTPSELESESPFWPLLESVEGSQEEPWPTSPPMQQVVEECFTPGAAPVLLGVGLSGNGHWSTAIESLDSKRLKFDVACKNSKNAAWLGSQYRFLVPFAKAAPAQAFPQEFNDIEPLPLSWNLELAVYGNLRIEMRVLIGKLEILDAERIFGVLPDSEPSETRTHRWCYEISIFQGQ